MRRILTWLNSRWVTLTFPFARLGGHLSIHYSCELDRRVARNISIGDDVFIGKDVWINVADRNSGVRLAIGSGCKIGRRCTVSAKNLVELEADVLLAPGVLIMDHNHEFRDVSAPIHAQGLTPGGRIRIERNCWLGYNAVIIAAGREVVIGRNSVVAANSVVTKSVNPYSLVAGAPAREMRRFDPTASAWVRLGESGEGHA